MKTIYKNLIVPGVMFLSLALMSLEAPPDGAKSCRCKPIGDGLSACLPAGAISFRPRCTPDGGDCSLGEGVCYTG